ncbi:MAG: hypothetical protein L6R28_11120 [Planctomycetes bacterium]|nr:hypothetical protein [Planctomycetota bacterium]
MAKKIVNPLLEPLAVFYARVKRVLPKAEQVDGEAIPQPHRRLLAHKGDMTPTLEAFHGKTIHLKVIECNKDCHRYERQVVLLLDGSERPVEFGAIRIHLENFPEAAREAIVEGHRPLGTILARRKIAHHSRPSAYFRIQPDDFIRSALGLSGHQVLYGRRNTLTNGEGRVLAEIVEILPPEREA